MKSRPLNKPVLILALAACAVRADYINSTVSLGGYVLDAKDVTHDGNFYQMERVNVSALKDGLGLHLAYGYSDFYDKRPNTYQNSNRLALANVSYAPGVDWLKVQAGRDFEPMIERSLYYDGGVAKLQYQDKVQGELFGGYGVPTVYQSDLVDFNSDKAIVGGKLTYTPMSALLIHLDGLVNGVNDDGSLGGEIQGRLGDRVTLSANSVYRLDSTLIQHAEIAALVRVRKNDLFQIRYGIQQQKIDSTRNYDYFVNKDHQFVLAGYVLSLTDKLSADLDYGFLAYDDTLGQTVNLKVNAYGFFVRVGQEFATVTNAFDLGAGFDDTYASKVRINFGFDFTRYDLDERNTGLIAYDIFVQPTYLLGHGFEATASYEFLHNRLYDRDNRFYVGVKESFFRGLSK